MSTLNLRVCTCHDPLVVLLLNSVACHAVGAPTGCYPLFDSHRILVRTVGQLYHDHFTGVNVVITPPF